MLLACSRSFLKFVMRYKFLIWMHIIRTPYIYVSSGMRTSPTGGGRSVDIVRSRTKAMEFSFSGMRIRGYFPKPKGVREQNVLGHNYLHNYTLSIFL
jgi:hypothetical protein